MNENEIGTTILNCAFAVHKKVGPGLLELPYRECLFHEIMKSGLAVQKEVPLPLVYDGIKMEVGYRLDIWVEKLVVAEAKSVESLAPIHTAHLVNYLKLTGNKPGYSINYNVPYLKDGIKRIANGLGNFAAALSASPLRTLRLYLSSQR